MFTCAVVASCQKHYDVNVMESTSFERRTRSQGRPRDTRIDDAVLEAANELLEEIGYT